VGVRVPVHGRRQGLAGSASGAGGLVRLPARKTHYDPTYVFRDKSLSTF